MTAAPSRARGSRAGSRAARSSLLSCRRACRCPRTWRRALGSHRVSRLLSLVSHITDFCTKTGRQPSRTPTRALISGASGFPPRSPTAAGSSYLGRRSRARVSRRCRVLSIPCSADCICWRRRLKGSSRSVRGSWWLRSIETIRYRGWEWGILKDANVGSRRRKRACCREHGREVTRNF